MTCEICSNPRILRGGKCGSCLAVEEYLKKYAETPKGLANLLRAGKGFLLLRLFGEMEGTWFSKSWVDYGISQEEQDEIERAYNEWEMEETFGPFAAKIRPEELSMCRAARENALALRRQFSGGPEIAGEIYAYFREIQKGDEVTFLGSDNKWNVTGIPLKHVLCLERAGQTILVERSKIQKLYKGNRYLA